jgi:hemerythrin superfamily protein
MRARFLTCIRSRALFDKIRTKFFSTREQHRASDVLEKAHAFNARNNPGKRNMAARTAQSTTATQSIPTSGTAAAAQDAATLLKSDHRKVEGIFAQYKTANSSEDKSKLAKQVCKELIVHTKLEEEIFYPACREKNVEDDMLDEAQVEHDGAKMMIAELISGSPDDEFYDAKVNVLSEYIKHHVGEEEKPRTGIFAKAKAAGVDMEGLGQKLQSRKQQLVSQLDENDLEPPKPRALHPEQATRSRAQEDYRMPRQSNYRERDERGRFTDDDDDRGRSRGGYSSRSRYDDDDDRSSRSSGRSRGGWFGDSEGHSEASREGWESRGSSRGGYSSRSRDDDDDDRRSSRGRGQGGWFGDPEGHSEASREGWESRGSSRSSRSRYDDDDDDDRRGSSRNGGGRGRGQGGWFGDSEGHAEAAREGWESRGSSRGSSRSRNDDDDDDRRGSSRGRSHGGWFGDSRGHSEAARRGWEDR